MTKLKVRPDVEREALNTLLWQIFDHERGVSSDAVLDLMTTEVGEEELVKPIADWEHHNERATLHGKGEHLPWEWLPPRILRAAGLRVENVDE